MAKIDSSRLMYWTFISGRASLPHTSSLIRILPAVVKLVQEQGRLVVQLPQALQLAVPSQVWKESRRAALRSWWKNDAVKREGLPLLELIATGSNDLQRLWERQEQAATRSICYALHNLPALLRQPHEFT